MPNLRFSATITILLLSIFSCKKDNRTTQKDDFSQLSDFELLFNESIERQSIADSVNLNLIGLDSIPNSIHELNHVKVLHLHFAESKINSLNIDFSKFKKLGKLTLSKTYLSDLPDSISELSSLEHLAIYGSQIKQIPASIASITPLEEIIIWRSKLSELPDELLIKSNLKKLDLVENQFDQITQSQIHNALPDTDITFEY